MGIRECPVCGLDQNADDTAFQHHVNGHFDSGPPPPVPRPSAGVSSPKKRRLSVMKAEEEESSLLGDDACPLCSFPFFEGVSAVEREQHVNACMDTSSSNPPADVSIPFSITHAPSRQYSSSSTSSRPHIATQSLRLNSFRPASTHAQHPEGDYQSPTYLLSDQLIQQSLASGRDDLGVADEWDGPARPGGFAAWQRTKGRNERRDHWWDPRIGKIGDVPENFTPGLIPILSSLLESSVHKGTTKRAVLGRDAVHIKSIAHLDQFWGCGYRNALMSISSFLLHSPSIAKLFMRESNGADPGIRRLQGWLDEAWAKGYDPEGKKHFKGSVLGGGKWVGTGDLYALFSYKGVPCDLYDFPKPKTAAARPAARNLTEWIKQYFDEGLPSAQSEGGRSGSSDAFDLLMRDSDGSRGSAIRRSDRYPLILQHNGHSRSVVGYEETSKGEMNLLMLDPGKSVPQNLREAALRHTSTHRSAPTRTQASIPRKASHESKPFSPPYTDGASTLTKWCDTPVGSGSSPVKAQPGSLDSAARRLDGGAVDLEDDEEMDERGWVKKRIGNLAKSVVRRDGESRGKKAKVNAGGVLADSGDVAFFRVNLNSLGRHVEYQILAFTGDKPLTPMEQSKRRYLTSTVIT